MRARQTCAMTYRISGLDPSPFQHLFGQSDEALAVVGVQRLVVDQQPGFPCRASLDDLPAGRTVLLLNHESVATGPYRATHAIFVEEGATRAAVYEDSIPPALDRRVLSLRAFDENYMMVDAVLASIGEPDGTIRRLFEDERVDCIHAHNATRGCFAAVVERGR
jgi:hypothetical protein